MPKTVLITGASAGFGRATALLFREKGWNVAASMRDPESAAWAAEAGLFAPRLDVTDQATIDAAVAETLARFGAIDVLVNNAGYGLQGPFEGASRAELAHQFEVNVLGLAAVTRAVLPTMRAAGSGSIVNIGSIAGRLAYPMGSAYNGTKYAVEGMSEALWFELRPFNIRVKLIEPGPFRTDFGTRSMRIVEHPAYAEMLRAMRWVLAQGLGRGPGPEPVARLILRAATDGSGRLRYVIKGQPIVALHEFIPAPLWRWVMGRAIAAARRFATANRATTVER